MKIASILMSLVFAGVVAQANEPAAHGTTAPATTETTAAAPTTEVKKDETVADTKAAKKAKKVAKKAKKEEKKEEGASH